jgi:hypothetical protein
MLDAHVTDAIMNRLIATKKKSTTAPPAKPVPQLNGANQNGKDNISNNGKKGFAIFSQKPKNTETVEQKYNLDKDLVDKLIKALSDENSQMNKLHFLIRDTTSKLNELTKHTFTSLLPKQMLENVIKMHDKLEICFSVIRLQSDQWMQNFSSTSKDLAGLDKASKYGGDKRTALEEKIKRVMEDVNQRNQRSLFDSKEMQVLQQKTGQQQQQQNQAPLHSMPSKNSAATDNGHHEQGIVDHVTKAADDATKAVGDFFNSIVKPQTTKQGINYSTNQAKRRNNRSNTTFLSVPQQPPTDQPRKKKARRSRRIRQDADLDALPPSPPTFCCSKCNKFIDFK